MIPDPFSEAIRPSVQSLLSRSELSVLLLMKVSRTVVADRLKDPCPSLLEGAQLPTADHPVVVFRLPVTGLPVQVTRSRPDMGVESFAQFSSAPVNDVRSHALPSTISSILMRSRLLGQCLVSPGFAARTMPEDLRATMISFRLPRHSQDDPGPRIPSLHAVCHFVEDIAAS